jgi:hypothetical protein
MNPDDDSATKVAPQEAKIGVGGEVVVPTQPEQIGYALRHEEFEILSEGDVLGKDERWRDVWLAIAITAFVGLLAVVPSVDWDRRLPLRDGMYFYPP